jgi:hypothetical protein
MKVARSLAPGIFDHAYRRLVSAQHYQHNLKVPPTEGNLFEPMRGTARISGGYDGRETIVGEVLQMLEKPLAVVGRDREPQ